MVAGMGGEFSVLLLPDEELGHQSFGVSTETQALSKEHRLPIGL